MTAYNRGILLLCGAGFTALGLAIWFSGGVRWPTRWPPLQFHFSGLSLFLLGGSPLVLGVATLAVASGALRRDARRTYVAIGTGMAMLGLAFWVAPKL